MNIRWQTQAHKDLQGVLHFHTNQRSTAGPKLVQNIIHFAIKQLQVAPQSGRQGRVEGTRELIVPGCLFVVVYRIKNNEIQILAIRHQARLWPNHF